MFDWLKIGVVVLITLLPSAAGIVWAIFVSGEKTDAFRGGAIATALALLFLFMSRNYGMKHYEAAMRMDELEAARRKKEENAAGVAPPQAPPPTLEEIASNLETLRAAIIIDGEEMKTLNICLAITTSIAALVCAFGDQVANHFINLRAHH